ncbi:DcaP family trimeric outer membrane transporter [Aurantiacibacter sp. MUD61]|uniref:DcaP family trimeric outer membrane transporter n=1 Tax=Aurantiacibacter sp. MUD61 TaxID=3009083 RepID=UPI0022F0332A|nr:DcaP family trimeric outer membrane transporter [Aurantiacibacter sp. MUD61]
MQTFNFRKGFCAALVGASCLMPATALAQEASIEDRLDRLEALVAGLVERLDAQQDIDAQQQADIAATADLVMAETTQMRGEQAELAAQVETVSEEQDRDGFGIGNTRFTLGGYVKMDALSLRTSGGQLPDGAITRDFLIPGAIPVGGEASSWDTDFNARQTRVTFGTSTDVGTGTPLRSHIEVDFMVTPGGDERISNSYEPRLRQAYLTYGDWLLGQTWSTFQNVGALPESMDFIGTTPGTVFDRQPMVRYTNGGLQIAVEQPETVVTTPTGGRLLAGDDTMPDVVVRYNYTGDGVSLTAAGIVRSLNIADDDFGMGDDSAFGYGLSLSGRIGIGERDDIRFMGTVGDGLGRYIGLNIVNDAALDLDGNLDPIFTYSGFAAFRHFWADDLRSTIAGSYFRADNPVMLTGNQVTDESWNAFVNLVYSPVSRLDVGIEYMYAERQLEDGRSGNLQKIQLSTRYAF